MLPLYNESGHESLASFLRNRLIPAGNCYERDLFADTEPGTVYEYSNLGVALLGYILERVFEKPFNDYARINILGPVGMDHSHWNPAKVLPLNRVTYYNELYREVPPYRIITYPDGGLYSSVNDLTLYAQELFRCYEGRGQLLSQASTKELWRLQLEGDDLTDGLCWDLSFDNLVGHGGNDFGTATLMYLNPSTGVGRILFTNVSVETEAQEAVFYGIFNQLFAYDVQ